MQKTSPYFQLNPQLFWKIDLNLCTYFTEEDVHLPFDRKYKYKMSTSNK